MKHSDPTTPDGFRVAVGTRWFPKYDSKGAIKITAVSRTNQTVLVTYVLLASDDTTETTETRLHQTLALDTFVKVWRPYATSAWEVLKKDAAY